jgi:hypothetical protein
MRYLPVLDKFITSLCWYDTITCMHATRAIGTEILPRFLASNLPAIPSFIAIMRLKNRLWCGHQRESQDERRARGCLSPALARIGLVCRRSRFSISLHGPNCHLNGSTYCFFPATFGTRHNSAFLYLKILMQAGFLAVESAKRRKIDRNRRYLFVTWLICLAPSAHELEVLSYGSLSCCEAG